MSSRGRIWIVAVMAGALSLAADEAAAALINVQFGNTGTTFGPSIPYTGAAVLGDADDLWNFAGGTFNPNYQTPDPAGWGRSITGLALNDVDGAVTSVKLDLTTPDAFISLEAFAPIFKGTPYANLMDSFVFADGNRLGGGGGADGPGFVTLSGLKPGAQYELYLLSAGDVVGRATTFTLNGIAKTATPSGAQAFIAGDTFVSYLVNADAGGMLAFSFEAGSGVEGNLNGLQLRDIATRVDVPDVPAGVPEPATWSLMIVGSGLAGAALRRRRPLRTL